MPFIKFATSLVFLLAAFELSANERTLDAELLHLNESIQPLLPIVVDDVTELVAADVTGTTFTRTFEIANAIEDIDVKAFEEVMGPALVNYVCNAENQKPLLQLGGSYRFVYQALEDEPMFSVHIQLDNCSP